MKNKAPNPFFTVHILSDGTGETAQAVVKATLVQYQPGQAAIVRHHNVRSEKQAVFIIENIKDKKNTLLVHTFAMKAMREFMAKTCQSHQIRHVDVFSPLFAQFEGILVPNKKTKTPGLFRHVNEEYYKRIEATEFSLKHDDGNSMENLRFADIVLVGVSRTSKTPLSLFLSFKGCKVANVPIVLGMNLPESLKSVDPRRIMGLTIDAEHLLRIRENRLKKLGWHAEYASKKHILSEMEYAREIFAKHKWPVLDVTDRALEETASEILYIMRARLGLQ